MTKPVTSRGALLLRRAELLEEQARIDRELAQLEASPVTDTFTSRDGERPHGYSRRRYAERCRKISTARREGKEWIVSRGDWFASLRRPSIPPVTATAAVASRGANDANDVDALLAGAGLRPTRRSS